MVKRNKVKICILMTVLAAVCIVTLILLQTLYKYRKYDESGIPDAVSSSYDSRECRLIVTANSSEIEDREQFAREVFRMCRENSFRTIKLSTDIQGWPERLDITQHGGPPDAHEAGNGGRGQGQSRQNGLPEAGGS